MHKNFYCRYILAGMLLCLWAPAKALNVLSAEPLIEVNSPLRNHTTVAEKSNAPFAGWYPPEFTAVAISGREVELTLTDRSYDDVRYEIHSDNFTQVVTMPDSGQTATFRDTDLEPYTTYSYRVDAFTEEQGNPVYSETIMVKTQLAPPHFPPYGVYYEENNIAFAISGYPNPAGTSVEIYRSLNRDTGYELIATVPREQDEYYDANLKDNTFYFYKLRARAGDDVSEFSAPESFKSFAKNHPPTISARALNDTTVEITFQDHSYNDIAYEIDNVSDYLPVFYEQFSTEADSGQVFVFHHAVYPGSTYIYQVNVTTQGDGIPNYYNVARDTVTTPVVTSCTGVGSIEREVWANITGTSISSVPFDTQPDNKYSYTSFETPQYFANNYGSRMRGYVCVPSTGYYSFWISSDDNSELWLSTDESPANKVKIASVTGHTGFRVWDKYSTQQSLKWYLVAGRKYYIEALHKEGNGNDHISVGWQLPGGELERPIPGNRLIPFDDSVVASCAGDPNLGSIQREIWRNIPGTSVSSIPVNSTPSNVVTLQSFQTQTYYANDYGSRIRGYVCVPATGNYTFWIASDDNSELWLSTNDSPDYKVKIASITGATRVAEWTKYSTQQSAPVMLTAGQKYYIEALHKEANGNDHVAVGWQLPGGAMERPIPGNRLIAYQDEPTTAAFAEQEVEESRGLGTESGIFSLYPNPSVNRAVSLRMDGDKAQELHAAEVEVVSVSGIVVHRRRIDCDQDCSDVLLSLEDNVPPGLYTVNVLTKGKRMSKRLLLK